MTNQHDADLQDEIRVLVNDQILQLAKKLSINLAEAERIVKEEAGIHSMTQRFFDEDIARFNCVMDKYL